MAGDALSGIGAYNQGKADQMAAEYNAQVAEQNAVYSIEKARAEENKQRIISKKFLGDMRASYGASGITSDSGSALDVLQESAAAAELDALTIRHEGKMRAMGLNNEAAYQRVAGKNARSAGNLRAAAYFAKGAESAVAKSSGGGG